MREAWWSQGKRIRKTTANDSSYLVAPKHFLFLVEHIRTLWLVCFSAKGQHLKVLLDDVNREARPGPSFFGGAWNKPASLLRDRDHIRGSNVGHMLQ